VKRLSLRDLALKNRNEGERKRRGRRLTSKESKNMRRRGYDAERSLVRKFRKLGFKAVRVPSSAPSSEPLPDVFATLNNTLLAVEVKASSGDKIRFSSNQVKKLFEFLEIFNVYNVKVALLAGKFPYRWVFKQVEEVDNYVLHKDDKGNIRLKDLLKRLKKTRFRREFQDYS